MEPRVYSRAAKECTVKTPSDHSDLLREFAAQFGASPSLARAPARVNIVGEHTDYNGGFVLPTTTALYSTAAWSPRDDGELVVCSMLYGETALLPLPASVGASTGSWVDYVLGVAVMLQEEGIELPGTSLMIDGEIPTGAGLSSSASLELAVAHALLDASRRELDGATLAKLCQRAENEVVGSRCGIMDQYAIAACDEGVALLLDCRTLEATPVALPRDAALLVVDSGIRHRLHDSQYNDRREQCEQALRRIAELRPGVRSLCDLDQSELSACAGDLDEILYRRSLHVVSENRRVAQAVAALRDADLPALGRLLNESHDSLKVDYEVTCPETDALVGLLCGIDGVFGARQMGAGFGGSVLALTSREQAATVGATVQAQWRDGRGAEPWWHLVTPAAPAGSLR